MKASLRLVLDQLATGRGDRRRELELGDDVMLVERLFALQGELDDFGAGVRAFADELSMTIDVAVRRWSPAADDAAFAKLRDA